ncbi:tetratricopeptide repeat protein [Aggregatilinea lenta]|uniref:tetratricopeptide repeat protein n=1 Tax=Aggregatilinea lenta TaxID=913108 RepID=UPI000E5BDA36|nr:tetratricopeptide repeat protein [Aggregatilinea lenta]
MVPPPDNAEMEFPDFDKMTPEEQMAWLESLARRQGAKDEEFTTAADLDIGVPEDAVIDEPGYVPFFERERLARAPRDEAPAPEAAAEPPAPEPEPVEAMSEVPVVAEQPVPEAPQDVESGLTDDPMRWLDSFTPHSEEVFGDLELDLEADDLAELDLGEFEPPDEAIAEQPPQPEMEPEPARADEPLEAVEDLASIDNIDFGELLSVQNAADQGETEAVDDEFLDGIDPMRWLESLAVRQGVPNEELTTSADVDIPEMPEDTVIDEPGYVPYDATDGTREPEWVRRLASESDVVNEAPTAPEAEAADFLEAEYGYTPPAEESAPDLTPATPSDAPDVLEEELAGSLSWMDDLTGAPDLGDFAAMLDLEHDILGAQGFEEPQAAVLAAEPEVAEAAPDDLLAGLTDDEILELQMAGELTGEQELLWLQRQAEKLAEARQMEAEQSEASDELEAAEPAALPEWLAEMRGEGTEGEAEAVEALDEELFAAVELEGLPDWLTQAEAAPPIAESGAGAELEALWSDEPSAELPLDSPVELSASEVDAFLSEQYAAGPDALAEALDAEYERRQTGDESEPDWYQEAMGEGEEGEPAPDAEGAVAGVEPEPELQPAVPVDLPDWLKDEADSESAEPPEEPPSWLDAPEPQPEPAQAAAASERYEAPVVQRAPESPAPAAHRASVPPGHQYDQYREQLDRDPADYVSRLSLARVLQSSGEVAGSLDHYEVLVESSAELPDVTQDLDSLARQQQENPRVHRLRGDTYMRRGMLQEALDAYRTALEQL